MRGEWSKPVEVELGSIGAYRVIGDTAQAAEALLYRWPVHKGKAYSAAKRVCLTVLEGAGQPDEAREAFLNAAEEAAVSVRDWQKNLPEGRSVGMRWGKHRRKAYQQSSPVGLKKLR